ncbi:hypothetical protein [Deinococcus aestuarii]|uniref:hypothetical protein n=1 Tax=Deinococcus aestuarii TaxID=2774531 RepID=UPI001C0C0833|nr:hypothetical protein [Deinococcus aestuarii]
MPDSRALRPALALLALGVLAAGALSGCAPAQSAQPAPAVSAQPISPYATRADAAVVVFQSRTARAGAVDLLLDGTPVLRRLRSTDSYRVFVLPPGLRTLSVQNSLSGTPLEAQTLDLRAGGSYALVLDVDPVTREYILLSGQGSSAISNLIGPG